VVDEILARAPQLVGVMDAGVDERLLDLGLVDRDRGLLGVLLDDGEQVAEQPALLVRQLRGRDDVVRVPLDAIDLTPRGRQQRRARRASIRTAATALALARATTGRGLRAA